MTPRFSIVVCETFAPDVMAAVKEEGFTDVGVEIFPLHCGSPHLTAKNILEQLKTKAITSTHIHYIGSSCFHPDNGTGDIPGNITFTHLPQCFDILLPSELTRSLINKKNYLISSGWLPSFIKQIEGWV